MEVPDLFIHPVTGNVFLHPYGVGCGGEVSTIEKGVQTVHFFTKCIH
jgi:hypothetical protein